MDDDWLPVLREVYEALDREALGPVVIGGRAVLLLRPSMPESLNEVDLSTRLGAFARITHDLDVALLARRDRLQGAHDLLTRQLGFSWAGEYRYTRGEMEIDVLKAQLPPDRKEEWPSLGASDHR